MRTYSVRDWDPDRLELTIDFVNHGGSGVAGPWAEAAVPGDRIQLIGPGGAYEPTRGRLAPDGRRRLRDSGDRRLAAADPAGVPAHVIISSRRARGGAALETPGELHLTWIHRDSAAELETDRCSMRSRGLDFPPGASTASSTARPARSASLRRHLLADRAIPLEDLSISGYWKRRRTEEGWREDKPEWKRQVEDDLRGGPGS